MREHEQYRRARGPEAGFALILAILALMLLTFLGLSLSMTTSTELQIATNYRWSQQAFFNAMAGIEIGKRYLQETEWRVFLPDARGARGPGAGTMGAPPLAPLSRAGAGGEASRNFENAPCDIGDAYSGQGYGVVLDSPNFTAPFQNTATFLGQTLNGSFTIWVRRPLVANDPANTTYMKDYSDPDKIEMTVEGTAPSSGSSNFALTNRAVRYVTLTVSKIDPSGCENYTGQQGMGPSGAGYDPCSKVDVRGIRGTAGGAGETGINVQ